MANFFQSGLKAGDKVFIDVEKYQEGVKKGWTIKELEENHTYRVKTVFIQDGKERVCLAEFCGWLLFPSCLFFRICDKCEKTAVYNGSFLCADCARQKAIADNPFEAFFSKNSENPPTIYISRRGEQLASY